MVVLSHINDKFASVEGDQVAGEANTGAQCDTSLLEGPRKRDYNRANHRIPDWEDHNVRIWLFPRFSQHKRQGKDETLIVDNVCHRARLVNKRTCILVSLFLGNRLFHVSESSFDRVVILELACKKWSWQSGRLGASSADTASIFRPAGSRPNEATRVWLVILTNVVRVVWTDERRAYRPL